MPKNISFQVPASLLNMIAETATKENESITEMIITLLYTSINSINRENANSQSQ